MIGSTERFGFGKYNGRLVSEVARFDPQYIWWVENNMSVRFTPYVKRLARFSADMGARPQVRTDTRRPLFY